MKNHPSLTELEKALDERLRHECQNDSPDSFEEMMKRVEAFSPKPVKQVAPKATNWESTPIAVKKLARK